MNIAFLFHLAVLEDVGDMAGDAGNIPAEKLLHLLLGEPYRFVFQRNVQRDGTVISLVNHDLVPEVPRVLHDHFGFVLGVLVAFGWLVKRFLFRIHGRFCRLCLFRCGRGDHFSVVFVLDDLFGGVGRRSLCRRVFLCDFIQFNIHFDLSSFQL